MVTKVATPPVSFQEASKGFAMLTYYSYKYLGSFFKLYGTYGILPFSWDEATNQVLVCSSKSIRTVVWALHVFVMTLQSFSCLIAAIAALSSGERSLAMVSMDLMFFFAYATFVMLDLTIMNNRHDYSRLFNSYFYFDRKASHRFLGEAEPEKKRAFWDMLILNCSHQRYAFILAIVTIFLQHPLDSRTLLSRIVDPEAVTMWHIISWAVVEAFQCYFCASGFWLVIFAIYISNLLSNYWLQLLQQSSQVPGEKKRSKNLPDGHRWKGLGNTLLRKSIREGLMTYKRLKILNVQYNDCLAGTPTITLLTYLVIGHIHAGFTSVKFSHLIPPSSFAIFPMILACLTVIEMVLFQHMGKVNESSLSYLNSWHGDTATLVQDRAVARELRSLAPMAVNCGSFYAVHKRTLLYFLMVVSSAIINLSLIIDS